MRRFRNNLLSTATALLLTTVAAHAGETTDKPAITGDYQHVLLISVDGLHAIDLAKWVEAHPSSAFAKLASTGIVYPNAFTTAPSDSFPGMIAQVTGASSKTAGLFYDDSYDRTMYPSAFSYQGTTDPGCTGTPGTEITNFEAIDVSFDPTSGITPDITGGGTLGKVLTQIDPNKLQRRLVHGECKPILPHEYIRTNTIFEIIKEAGGLTAWSDKHPAYEILSGPSGKGIDDLFTPEINAQMVIPNSPTGSDNTTSYAGVRAYDSIKVDAVINWIHGFNSTQTAHPGVPAIFGMNFQAVSVGQKLAKAGFGDDASLTGGYLDSNATPGNALTLQLEFVDDALGKFETELKKQGIDGSTLIIVSAKHGQSPIDPKVRLAQSDKGFQKVPGYGDNGFEICDDTAYIWLQPDLQQASYDAARAYLQANAAMLHIQQLLDRTSLTPLYGDPFENSRVPDFVAVTDHGVICTGGSKLSEHGGFSDDDRNVALLLSAPKIKPEIVETLSYTTQIAPTILAALDLDPHKLKATRTEGTRVLTK